MLWLSTRFNTKVFLAGIVLLGPLYVAVRIPNLWSGQHMVDFIGGTISAERAQSLADRFRYESLLVARAVEQPIFGWGGWDRSAVYTDDENRDAAHTIPPDGLWISTLGTKGFVGLILLYIESALPVALFLSRFPVRLWRDPRVAPAALVATLLGLSIIDNLFNGSINIAYVSLAGGLASITPAQLGMRNLGARGTRDLANQVSRMLPTGTVGAGSSSRTLTGAQPGWVLPHSVVSRMPVVDQYRKLGRTMKSEARWADAQLVWQHALDMLTELTGRHPDNLDLQSAGAIARTTSPGSCSTTLTLTHEAMPTPWHWPLRLWRSARTAMCTGIRSVQFILAWAIPRQRSLRFIAPWPWVVGIILSTMSFLRWR